MRAFDVMRLPFTVLLLFLPAASSHEPLKRAASRPNSNDEGLDPRRPEEAAPDVALFLETEGFSDSR